MFAPDLSAVALGQHEAVGGLCKAREELTVLSEPEPRLQAQPHLQLEPAQVI